MDAVLPYREWVALPEWQRIDVISDLHCDYAKRDDIAQWLEGNGL